MKKKELLERIEALEEEIEHLKKNNAILNKMLNLIISQTVFGGWGVTGIEFRAKNVSHYEDKQFY